MCSCYTYTYVTYIQAEWISMYIRIKDKYLNSIVNTHTVQQSYIFFC